MVDKHIPQPLEQTAFPKVCKNCQKVYQNEMQFLRETNAIPYVSTDTRAITPIPGAMESENNIYLEVFRNCACGSTLMERFYSRRNLSEAGIERRIAFEVLLSALEVGGVERIEARRMLLAFLDTFSSN